MELSSTLYTAKKTQLEMLRDRGFDISRDLTCLELPYEEAVKDYNLKLKAAAGNKKIKTYRDLLKAVYLKPGTPEKTIVFYASSDGDKEIGKEKIAPLADMVLEENPSHAVVIVDSTINSYGRDFLDKLKGIYIQVFREKELQFNVNSHVWVPRHERMSDEKAKEYLARGQVRLGQLPIIRINDPVVKYWAFPPKSIIIIHRKNPTTDATIDREIGIRVVSEK